MARTLSDAFEEIHGRLGMSAAQTSTATEHLRGLGNFMTPYYGLVLDPVPVGSFARATVAAGVKDLDVLAIFPRYGSTNYWPRFTNDSSAFVYWVRSGLARRYPSTKVSTRQVSVKLDYSSIVTDVTPVFMGVNSPSGYILADGQGGWRRTNPVSHTAFIQQEDLGKSGRLRRLIRLMKYWNWLNGSLLRSFHLEVLVTRIQAQYGIGTDWFEVGFTLGVMQRLLETPTADPWDPTLKIDDYLTPVTRALARTRVQRHAAWASDAYDAYAKRYDLAESFRLFDLVFAGRFPVLNP